MKIDPFEILGIPKKYVAAIKREELMRLAEAQYKTFQRIFHPDVTFGTEQISKDLNSAITILRDPESYAEAILECISEAKTDSKEIKIKHLVNEHNKLKQEIAHLKSGLTSAKQEISNIKEHLLCYLRNVTVPENKHKRDFIYLSELNGYRITYLYSEDGGDTAEVDVQGYFVYYNNNVSKIVSGSLSRENCINILRNNLGHFSVGMNLTNDQFMSYFSGHLMPYVKTGNYLVLSSRLSRPVRTSVVGEIISVKKLK